MLFQSFLAALRWCSHLTMGRFTLAAIALLALFAASACAKDFSYDYDFVAGVNVSINGQIVSPIRLTQGGLQLRTTPLLTGLFGPRASGFISSTTGVNVSLLGLPVGLAVDYEVDIADLATGGPYHLNAHWNASALLNIPGFDFQAGASANLIASFPFALVEVDTEGVEVAVHYIKDQTWRLLSGLRSLKDTIGVVGYTCAGQNNDSTYFNLTLSLQTSRVAGVSNFLRYNLLPRSWVHAFNVTGYVLRSATNSLRLVQAVATANVAAGVDITVDGKLTCPHGDGELLQAYADLNATVVVDSSTTANATISAWAVVDSDLADTILDDFAALRAQLNAKFNSGFSLYFANITYPQGKGNCSSTGRTATGSRLAEAQQAPEAPVAPQFAPSPTAPTAPSTPSGNPVNPTIPAVPTPSSASSVPVSFAVVIAFLALLGIFF